MSDPSASSWRTQLALSSGTALLLLILVAVYTVPNSPWRQAGKTPSRLEDHAFGSLSSAGSSLARTDQALLEKAPSATSGAGGSATVSQISYRYNGSAASLTEAKLEVLRRKEGTVPKVKDLGTLSRYLPLSPSSDATLSRFTLLMEGEHYQVDTDLASGLTSLYRQSASSGREKLAEVPATLSEAELIDIADRFITGFGIDRSSYGPAQLQKSGAAFPASDIVSLPLPVSSNLVYPLLIKGLPVYDAGGGLVGLSLGINAQEKKVDSLSGLRSLDLETSLYEAETDFEQLRRAVSRSGFPYFSASSDGTDAGQEQEIELESPTPAYLLVSQYADTGSTELFVPALAFALPADKVTAGLPARIIVPLAKELLQQATEEILPPDTVIQPAPALAQ